jgi:DNA-binding SARP family transcriptional activator
MVRGRQGATLSLDTALALQTAIELYRGELLDGWFQDWCLFERERLQNVYLTLVDKLIDYHEAAGAYERGISLGMDALRYDHAREEVHRRLMRLYYLTGDRTAALRQYERCAAVLHEALGVPPADLTTLLYYQIKSGKLELVEAELESPTAASGTLRALLDNLCQIQAALSELHRRVQQNIREVEVALREQQ